MMFDIQLTVAFVSIFIGVFLRTLLPSIDKLRAGQRWDNTYTATAIFAVVTSFVTAVMVFPTFNLPPDTTGIFTTFIISFVFGWGLNDFYNKIFADLHDTPATTTTAQAQTTAQPAQTEAVPQGFLGSYQGWSVYVTNGYLTVYPPQQYVQNEGSVVGIGNISGYPATTDFMAMARKFIDAEVAKLTSPSYGSQKTITQPGT
jgi:hypothetical protein